MKIERLSQDKIRIFLTFDDLMERGIQKDDMWREIPKVHDLFSDMMDQAYTELGFDASGPLAVEVFALPAQGMVVIVTRGKVHPEHQSDEDEDADDVYELEVTLEQSDLVIYAFRDFEHVLEASRMAGRMGLAEGALFSYKDKWVLLIEPQEMDEKRLAALVAVLSEYGDAASLTRAVLEEYGKTVIAEQAISVLCSHFN